ncbi:MAG: hypothetical protein ABEH86_10565 [Haloarcula sp.]
MVLLEIFVLDSCTPSQELSPDSVTTPHTHDGQEEVFIAMTGGQIAIEGDVHEVPSGGIVRVHPDTVRNLCDHTDA